jgi:putative transposase
MVDVTGFLLAVSVTEANTNDKLGGDEVIAKVVGKFPAIKKLMTDGSYEGEPFAWRVKQAVGWEVESVKQSDIKGFAVRPMRWIVERTFGWLGRWRRLLNDYEFLKEVSEGMVEFALLQNLVARVARKGVPKREVRKPKQVVLSATT